MDVLTELAIRLDPSLILDEMGFDEPDPWQRRLLRSTSERMLLNCHRQAGKSTATAGIAINTIVQEPDALVLLVSASLRQAKILFKKVVKGYRAIGAPFAFVEDTTTSLTLANGSAVVCLPDDSETIVGFSAPRLIVIDEGAMVSEATAMAVHPMLAISRGRLIAMSTPRGKRGWWSDAWHDGGDIWERIKFVAADNPRIDPEWLDDQRKLLGPRWFAQEFMCSFEDAVGQCFATDAIMAAFSSDEEPLFAEAL